MPRPSTRLNIRTEHWPAERDFGAPGGLCLRRGAAFCARRPSAVAGDSRVATELLQAASKCLAFLLRVLSAQRSRDFRRPSTDPPSLALLLRCHPEPVRRLGERCEGSAVAFMECAGLMVKNISHHTKQKLFFLFGASSAEGSHAFRFSVLDFPRLLNVRD
jgi:hypothetical protein